MDISIPDIFTQAPKPPNTITLDLDQSNVKELFESLISLFTDAMKLKYGVDGVVYLNTLTLENIQEM